MTHKKAINIVYADIVKEFFPIIGLSNTAMVPSNESVRNVVLDQVPGDFDQACLAVSTCDLDRIFHNLKADFFVRCSSINCVIGAIRHMNHAAAISV